MGSRSNLRCVAPRAIILSLAFFANWVPDSRADVATPPALPDAQAALAVRDYTELLKAEAQGLREAAEGDSRRLDRALTTFNWIVGVVGAIFVFGAGVFGSLLVFASRASKKDIHEEVSKQMQARVEREINQWPPRILFAPQSLISKVRDEVDDLVQNGGGKFLSPVTSPERFFEAVRKTLGQP